MGYEVDTTSASDASKDIIALRPNELSLDDRIPKTPPDRLHYFASGEAAGNELFQISLRNCHLPSGCGFQTCM